MKAFNLLVILMMAGSPAFAQGAAADLMNVKGEKIGTAVFTEAEGGVKISLEASMLPPSGTLAIHIHSAGVCTGPDFASAGPHFNPYGKKHGFENPDGSHAGDLPNLQVGSDGTLKTEMLAKNVTLEAGMNSLLQKEGTALVIHAGSDDEVTDPSGNSGARIVCGVIHQV